MDWFDVLFWGCVVAAPWVPALYAVTSGKLRP